MDFIPITHQGNPWYEQAFALYSISFPLHEQRLLTHWSEAFLNPTYHCDALIEDGQFQGILFHWDKDDYSYIEHFAICPDLRGKSVGSRALRTFSNHYTTVILEIDPPIDDISLRRQDFYARLGFQVNPFAHVHPAYRKDFAPHALVVLSFPHKISHALYQDFNDYLQKVIMPQPENL